MAVYCTLQLKMSLRTIQPSHPFKIQTWPVIWTSLIFWEADRLREIELSRPSQVKYDLAEWYNYRRMFSSSIKLGSFSRAESKLCISKNSFCILFFPSLNRRGTHETRMKNLLPLLLHLPANLLLHLHLPANLLLLLHLPANLLLLLHLPVQLLLLLHLPVQLLLLLSVGGAPELPHQVSVLVFSR